jgi:hypothetical protein
MQKQHLIVFTVLVLVFAGSACTPSNRPAGLPKLHSCSITITQDGTPVKDVSVMLVPKFDCPWGVSGVTDASGTAKLVTYGQFPGAPEGAFTVVLSKTESVFKGEQKAGEEFPTGTTEIFSLIDVEHTKSETSKLEITIEAKSNTASFDVGKPVRVLVDTVRPGT